MATANRGQMTQVQMPTRVRKIDQFLLSLTRLTVYAQPPALAKGYEHRGRRQSSFPSVTGNAYPLNPGDVPGARLWRSLPAVPSPNGVSP
jgi:hypothetical protein